MEMPLPLRLRFHSVVGNCWILCEYGEMCSSIAEERGEPRYQVENAVLTAHLYLKSLGRLFSGILYVMCPSLPMAGVWN